MAKMAFQHNCMDAAVPRPEGRTMHRYMDVTN
jgi:hypothetical protein